MPPIVELLLLAALLGTSAMVLSMHRRLRRLQAALTEFRSASESTAAALESARGAVELLNADGKSLVGLEPNQVTNRGVARTFQTLRLFLNMSVRENVMASQYGRTKATVFEAMLRLPRARRDSTTSSNNNNNNNLQ